MPIQGVREIVLKFTGDDKDLKSTSASGRKQVNKWRDSFKKLNRAAVAGSLAVVAGFAKMAKDSVGLSRRMSDLDTKARAVFEDQLAPMQKWADGAKKAFGLSSRETLGLAANFADLLKPMGFTAEQAAEMSTEVLDLSGALAKWSGGQHDAAQVSEILSKAMLGEREQLKSLGISITEADVKARLAKKGQEDLTGAALQQAKAIATQELILEKSTDAQEAWADSGKEAAEAENAMSVAVAELQEKLARTLGPAIVKGTELLAKLADWVGRNEGLIIKLGGAILGLAGLVLIANAAYKAYIAVTSAVVVVTKAWAVAQKVLNLAMKANPVGLIITAIAALIGIVVAIEKKTGFFTAVWSKAWGTIRNAVATAFQWIKDNWRLVLAIITGPIGIAVGIVTKHWDKIKSGARSVKDGIVGFFRGLGSTISSPFISAFNTIRSWWNSTIGGFGFSTPDWLPKIGGRDFRIPFMHSGGIFEPPAGMEEGLAVLRRGERVLTPGEARGRGAGGDTYNVNVQAWSDRFSWSQVKRELRNHGIA